MSLDLFLHNLHFDTDKARPPDLEVDWEDAPLKFKLYRGVPIVPLSPEVPLTLEGREAPMRPELRSIGHLLWYAFGFSRYCQTVAPDFPEMGSMQWPRRFVPSGGGLYPSELYVYLKLDDLPAGVYHYDPAHHRLALLREGDFDTYLSKALGNRCDISACFGAVFVSTLFWKNFYKYNNFAYRLQGLDAGVLIGQLLETAKRFKFASGVYFQFLDRAVNHLLGLSEQEESVYAIIPLSVKPENTWFADRNVADKMVSAAELRRELPPVQPIQYVRSKRVKEFPMLIKMNEASIMETTQSFRRIEREKNVNGECQAVFLPQVQRLSYDLASVSRRRHSPDTDFVLRSISLQRLAVLLHEATASFSYRNDLERAPLSSGSRVSLYGCFYGVEGIPDGAYRYDSAAHALWRLRPGDLRHRMQQAMTLHNVNLFQVPLCLHVAGGKDHLTTLLGYRGYRIAQMEAGMLVQRLLLAATALGMGGRPLLGFDVNACDEIYKMDLREETSLIQIPVGPYRPRPRLEGSLHG